MNLILKIIDSRNFDPQGNNVKEFHATGGSIGRGTDNDFVLPDQEKTVSKLHAFLHYRDQQFYLTDVSTNGVFFNEEDVAVSQTVDNPRVIHNGDQLRIGHYLLQATLEEDADVIVDNMQANNQYDDITADIEALLSGSDNSHVLPTERVKVDHRIDGKFGGEELHRKLGIETTTREAKHVAGDLNIDDFLNQGFDINTLPDNDIDDLLDLDSLDQQSKKSPAVNVSSSSEIKTVLHALEQQYQLADPASKEMLLIELKTLLQ